MPIPFMLHQLADIHFPALVARAAHTAHGPAFHAQWNMLERGRQLDLVERIIQQADWRILQLRAPGGRRSWQFHKRIRR